MFSHVKLEQDDTGYLSGIVYSARRDAVARLHISEPEGRHNPGKYFRAFLNNGFIGEYETQRDAVDSFLSLANSRYAAGGLRM